MPAVVGDDPVLGVEDQKAVRDALHRRQEARLARPQGCLGLLLLAEVAHVGDEGDAVLVPGLGHDDLDRNLRAVLAAGRQLGAAAQDAGLARGEEPPHAIDVRRLQALGNQDLAHRAADH